MPTPYLTRTWPRAIVHVDGDAFFASVAQAVDPRLKGKPVVTGQERGIIAAASYEAKQLGIKRGVSLWDARKMCKDLIVLPTDYETCSLYSKRMYEIMREYTPAVEEYSIDEGFADITGTRRANAVKVRGFSDYRSYAAIAYHLKMTIQRRLGITVSVGLSLSKTLCKIASDLDKPNGFVAINTRNREEHLKKIPIEDVWGIGPNTSALLKSYGFCTAFDFARAPYAYIKKIVTKPHQEAWRELNGESVLSLETSVRRKQQTMCRSKTFTPASSDREFVWAQVFKNLEGVTQKARRFNQAAAGIVVYLKKQDHRSAGLSASLTRASAYPTELAPLVRRLFDQLYEPNTDYRASGVILTDLVDASPTQVTLFENPLALTKNRRLYRSIDELREKYGKYSVQHLASLPARNADRPTDRYAAHLPQRVSALLKGESRRRRLPVPMLQEPVG